jgi:LacI family transcriptional regulator
MAKKVSIKDVAKKVGVSTALVSYVISGKEKEKRVGKEVADKIRKVAMELNYNPNQIARSLRRGSTKTIGLIVADIANPFFGQLIRVIEDEATKNGYTVIFGSSDENLDKSLSLIETFLHRQVDGLIIVPSEGENGKIGDLIDAGVPLVLMDRYFPEINACHVCLNNYQATLDATNHLIKNGSEHITLVAYKTSLIHMKERIRGYIEAMNSCGLNNLISVIEVPYLISKNDTQNYIEKCINDTLNIDAIIFATNSLSLSGLYALNRMSVKIPDELKIIGFDGNEAFDFFYAPLTYVEQPLGEIGAESVRLLTGLIEGSKEVVRLDLNHTLNVRKSSG